MSESRLPLRFERYRQYASSPLLMVEFGRFGSWYLALGFGSRIWKVWAR